MAVVPGFRSEWHGFVYDTLNFAVNTALPNPIQFFVNALGQGTSPTVGSGGKQVQDTNLTEPQKLPNTAPDMWVYTIRLIVSSLTTFNDLARLMKNYVLTFYVNSGIYAQGPIELFAGGGGVYAPGALSTALLAATTPTFGAINGFPACSSTLLLSKPVGIGQGETFRIELNGQTFTTDVTASTVFGQGIFMRAVLEGQIGVAADQR